MMQRTAKFIERYGLKTSWLAEKTRIPKNYFSRFLNSHVPLYDPQYNRLVAFMDEWDRRMVGFTTLDNWQGRNAKIQFWFSFHWYHSIFLFSIIISCCISPIVHAQAECDSNHIQQTTGKLARYIDGLPLPDDQREKLVELVQGYIPWCTLISAFVLGYLNTLLILYFLVSGLHLNSQSYYWAVWWRTCFWWWKWRCS